MNQIIKREIKLKLTDSKKGIILLLSAEICFSLSTVFVKLLTKQSEIPTIEITFCRFLFGVFAAGAILYFTKTSIIPNKINYVILRAILNTAAFILFFTSVKYTSITNANMLNMTYPLFIFLLTPFFIKKIPTFHYIIFIICSMTGIYLVINPNFNQINLGDLYGLASGITGAAAILSLRMARKYDSSFLILFYLMAIGLIINGILMLPYFIIPAKKDVLFLVASAIIGFCGQACLTIGYKFISARYGSIISSSRVIFAAIFGITLLSEKLNIQIIIGGMLIIFSIIGIRIKEKA
jgi:drug/metabolite transporter (DMT)-like permease